MKPDVFLTPPPCPDYRTHYTSRKRKSGRSAAGTVLRLSTQLRQLGADAGVAEVGEILQGQKLAARDYTTLVGALRKQRSWRLALCLGLDLFG